MKSRIAIVLAALMIGGCVQTVDVQTPFNPAEYTFALKKGAADVTGQGFLRRNDGIVVYGAGSVVLLIPVTPYTTEINAMDKAGQAPKQMDPRLSQFVKKVQADGEGRFAFHDVPDGTYFVNTVVHWMAGDFQQGGSLTKKITVSNGKNVNVILTE